jgi:hypothetical protein
MRRYWFRRGLRGLNVAQLLFLPKDLWVARRFCAL